MDCGTADAPQQRCLIARSAAQVLVSPQLISVSLSPSYLLTLPAGWTCSFDNASSVLHTVPAKRGGSSTSVPRRGPPLIEDAA